MIYNWKVFEMLGGVLGVARNGWVREVMGALARFFCFRRKTSNTMELMPALLSRLVRGGGG